MDDLRQTENGILILVVEAVDEDERMAADQMLADPASARLYRLDLADARDGKILGRIRRQPLRPLHLAGLPAGRKRYDDLGQMRLRAALAAKQRRPVAGGLARRGDKHFHPRRLRRCRRHRNGRHDTRRMSAPAQCKEDDARNKDLHPHSIDLPA
jgi:hypothetical protein